MMVHNYNYTKGRLSQEKDPARTTKSPFTNHCTVFESDNISKFYYTFKKNCKISKNTRKFHQLCRIFYILEEFR